MVTGSEPPAASRVPPSAERVSTRRVGVCTDVESPPPGPYQPVTSSTTSVAALAVTHNVSLALRATTAALATIWPAGTLRLDTSGSAPHGATRT